MYFQDPKPRFWVSAPSLVDINVIKVFGRATNGLLSRSLLFHSFLSLFSHPNVKHFCFFQEEEDRKIIKKGLPFFFAFLWIVGVPVDVNVTDSLSVFCPFCPPLTLVFPLVKSKCKKKVRKLVEILSVTCAFLNWSDYTCLNFQNEC